LLALLACLLAHALTRTHSHAHTLTRARTQAEAKIADVTSIIGAEIAPEDMCKFCNKMQLVGEFLG
jgi:hypothetical protein